MDNESIEQMLTGGHPNSLGRTIEVVEMVLNDTIRFDELYNCYFCDNEVVRLRVSNAMKRIYKEKSELVVAYLPQFLDKVSRIDQPSTQWTMAQLFLWMQNDMTADQLSKAKDILKRNLSNTNDWIVENATIETLTIWAQDDPGLKAWLLPVLEKYSKSPRKSVANRAKKNLAKLST